MPTSIPSRGVAIPAQRLALLASMPATRSDLVRVTGISTRTVYAIIERMVEKGEAHISTVKFGYQNCCLPVFDVGPGADIVPAAPTPRKKRPAKVRPVVLPQHAAVKQEWYSCLGAA